MPGPSYDVFLSHSHADAPMVAELAARLRDEASFRVWLDKWILIPGGLWQREMATGLAQARTCAICIGRNTPTRWFSQEVEKALNRQAKDESFRVIPVILPDGDISLVNDFLELRTWVNFRNGITDSEAFHLLKCGVTGISPGRYQDSTVTRDEEGPIIRERLNMIRLLRRDQLIDREIHLEYQRKILDKHIMGGGR